MIRDYLELPLPVRVLCLGSLVNRAGSFVVIFLTIYASEELGFGVGFASACMGAFGIGSMFGSVLGGHLADQLGRRAVMLTALIGGALALLLVGAMENRWAFMGSVAFFGIVADMYRPAASAMIADQVSIERRPHAFALMYISVNLGFAIAPPIGGLLAEYSYRLLFWGDACTMILYGLIILALIPESRPSHADDGHADDPNNRQANTASSTDAIARILGDRTFLIWCLATFFIALVFMQSVTTLPIYIRQLGLSNLQFGLLMSVNGMMIFILQLPLTHWLSRYNAMSVVILGGLLIAVGFGLCGLSGGFFFLALTIVVWTLGEILQAPFKHSIVTDMAPPDLRGRYLGVFTMCYAFSLAIGAPLGGGVLATYGPVILWSGTFGVALAAVSLYLLLYGPISRRIATDTSAMPTRLAEPREDLGEVIPATVSTS